MSGSVTAAPGVQVSMNEAPDHVLIGIYDGNEYALDARIADNYAPLTGVISKDMQKHVSVEVIKSNRVAMHSIKNRRYAFLFARYPDLAANALKEGHQVVMAANENITVKFIVDKNSPLLGKVDAAGKKWAVNADAFSGNAGLMELSHLGLPVKPSSISFTNHRDAVSFMVKNGYADIGMIISDGADDWTASGGRVLFESRKFPSWSLIASSRLPKEQIDNIRADLLAYLQAPENKNVLKRLGVGSVGTGNEKDYLDVLAWMGNK
jgi:ABC-type phosphate/phosphonate transport system substrate-binding protein